MIGADDPVLYKWIYGIIHGEPTPSGDFLRALAEAAVRADFQAYPMLRPALMQIRFLHPKYECKCEDGEIMPLFLATDDSDPRCEFITSPCEALGESGSIVVYNPGFESQRLSELAAWLPEFAQRIRNIRARLWDLLPIVRNHVYHPAFGGSFSLKVVLPALVPEMTYEGMEVANGQDAGLAWGSLVRASMDEVELDKIRKALLEYCRQDTLALVKIVAMLRSISTDLAQVR